MSLSRVFRGLSLAVALGFVASAAQAVPLQWTLSGLNFTQGGSVTGSFVYDAPTDTYSNVMITTTGTVADGSFDLALTFSSNIQLLAVNAALGTDTGDPLIRLLFESPLTDLGGMAPVSLFQVGTCFMGGAACDSIVSLDFGRDGSVTASAVPSPGTLPLMASSLMALWPIARRRRLSGLRAA